MPQEKRTENRFGFVESWLDNNNVGQSGLTVGGYFFEERSQALSLDAVYLNGKLQLFLNRQPGREIFIAVGFNIGAVQHRIRYDAWSDSSAIALLNPDFYKLLPDWSTGIYLSFPAGFGKIWIEYAIPPTFRFGKVYGNKGYRDFISVGLTKQLRGKGAFDIYTKLATFNNKFNFLDGYLNGNLSDHIAGLSFAPYSIPIYGGVSFNTRQEKIYFDIGTSIIVKTEGWGILYKRSGLSLKYTFESKGKGFQAHSLGVVFFQNKAYRPLD